MPRVRRPPPVRLAAPASAVRAAALACLDGATSDDHAVRVPVADHGLAAVSVLVTLTDDGPDLTSVGTTGEGRIGIPFFGWAFRPLVAASQRRMARYAVATLRAELEGGAPPPPPKPVVGLPTAPFTDAQATHLAT